MAGINEQLLDVFDAPLQKRLRIAAAWAADDGRTLLANVCLEASDEIVALRERVTIRDEEIARMRAYIVELQHAAA